MEKHGPFLGVMLAGAVALGVWMAHRPAPGPMAGEEEPVSVAMPRPAPGNTLAAPARPRTHNKPPAPDRRQGAAKRAAPPKERAGARPRRVLQGVQKGNHMSSPTEKFPTGATSGAPGDVAWGTPENAKVHDSNYAVAAPPLAATETTETLTLTGFDFPTLAEANIVGVQVFLYGAHGVLQGNAVRPASVTVDCGAGKHSHTWEPVDYLTTSPATVAIGSSGNPLDFEPGDFLENAGIEVRVQCAHDGANTEPTPVAVDAVSIVVWTQAGPATYTIGGTVLQADGVTPYYPGASVVLAGPAPSTQAVASDGSYLFEGLYAGAGYRVSAMVDGQPVAAFTPSERVITLPPSAEDQERPPGQAPHGPPAPPPRPHGASDACLSRSGSPQGARPAGRAESRRCLPVEGRAVVTGRRSASGRRCPLRRGAPARGVVSAGPRGEPLALAPAARLPRGAAARPRGAPPAGAIESPQPPGVRRFSLPLVPVRPDHASRSGRAMGGH